MPSSYCTCNSEPYAVTKFNKLKLMLWKNVTIKKRKALILCFEIFLPLTLSLILLGARRNQPIETAPPEYNQVVPLPTAGWIPMLQFLCPETNQTDPYGFPIYVNNSVPELINFLTRAPGGYPINIESINALLRVIKLAARGDLKQSSQNQEFSDAVDTLMLDPILSPIIMDAMTGTLDVSKGTNRFDSALRTSKFIVSQLPANYACNIHRDRKTSNDNRNEKEKVTSESEDDYITIDKVYNFRAPKQSVVLLLRVWNSLQSVLCGVNNTINQTIFNDPDWIHQLGFGEKQITKLKLFAFFLLRGHPQILYTPNTTYINQVIRKANESFEMLENLFEYSELLYNSSMEVKALLKKPSVIKTYWSYKKDNNIRLPDIRILKQFTNNLIQITCFLKSAKSKLNLDVFRPFSDEQSMARYSTEADRRDDIAVIAGLAFETNENGELPPHVVYKLKMNDTYAPRTVHLENRLWYQNHHHDDTYRFLLYPWIQDVVERAIIEEKVGRSVFEPGVHIREFPQPCRRYDDLMETISMSYSMFFILKWIYYVITFTQSIVHEKEGRLKEMMKIMGVNDFTYWLSWFLTCIIEMAISVTLLVVMVTYGQLFPYSNPFLLWLYLMLSAVTTVLFSFAVSVFFTKAKLAAACASVLHLVVHIPYIYIMNAENSSYMTVSRQVKILASLLPQSAYLSGIRYILQYELQAKGLTWETLNAPLPEYNQDLTIATLCIFVIFDCMVYVLVIWYVGAVYPGKYGVPQPWYFPCLKSYWCSGTSTSTCTSCHIGWRRYYQRVQNDEELEDTNSNGFTDTASNNHLSSDSLESDFPVGVRIKNLVKVYKNGEILAVKNLNLNLYEGQITVLLGHNGAGKTTLMSLLTGFITPTAGTAIIDGKDIRSEMVQIRRSLGVCPQFNALFDKLTVEEHLWFYSKIKGAMIEDFENEKDRILTDIGLYHKRHSTVNTLSGGMKRKLSVAVAFSGGAKTVIFDEPTAGVDPYSRRAIWDLLQKYKQGRTILLSTHHMDEASLLGDKVAILDKGQLKCCGSPQYLKNYFGSGYTLKLTKENDNLATGKRTHSGTNQANPELVTTFIKQYLPMAKFHSKNCNELLYHIPAKDTPKSQIIKLFTALSTHKRELCISSYSMTETTLEQIYLQITRDDSPTPSDDAHSKHDVEIGNDRNISCQDSTENFCMDEIPLNTEHVDIYEDTNRNNKNPATPTSVHLASLFVKRLQYCKRDAKMFFLQMFFPTIFVACAVGMAAFSLNLQNSTTLTLQSTMYKTETTYVPFSDEMKVEATMGLHGDGNKDNTVDRLVDALFLPAGLGAACLLTSPYNTTFDKLLHPSIELTSRDFNQICQKTVPKSLKVSFPYGERVTEHSMQSDIPAGECHCKADSTGMQCTDDDMETSVTEYRLISSEILQDLTGRNLSDFLMRTSRDYNQTRYGALSFIRPRTEVMKGVDPSSPFRRMQTKTAAVAWYNFDSVQSVALYVNMMNNVILRANIDPVTHGNPSAYGITAINEPLHSEGALVFQFIRRGIAMQIANMMMCGAAFIPASVVIFLVYERSSKAKQLHFISGVTPPVYWLSNYMWDMIICQVPIFFCLAVIYASGVEVYSLPHNLVAIAALFIFYTWSIIPMMYPMSFLFDVPSSAFVVVYIFNVSMGSLPAVLMFFLRYILHGEIFAFLSEVCHKIFVLLPNYCFAYGLLELSYVDMTNTFYQRMGYTDKVQSPFEYLAGMFLVMAVEGFVFFGFAVLCEYRIDDWLYRKFGLSVYGKDTYVVGHEDDEEVAHERKRILRGSDDDVLVLVNLTKVYKTTKRSGGRKTKAFLTAVNKLCLGVPQGQCFGLLGINGAGKTTLFQMLTGDKSITSGDAFVHGHSISRDIRSVYRHIGYCPQVDALYDKLTGREHLMLYAKLRGVPRGQRHKAVEALLKTTNMVQYADKLTETYSGGNKRKLSTAVSLVGNPAVIFMDEPTSGMDPQSKRFLWDVIHNVVRSGTSVIFTSHSMEECEHLCSRLAIMVNGQFKCIGSRQHLKSKFGDGYTVTVSLNRSNPQQQDVSEFFKHAFPDSVIKDSHHYMVEFEVRGVPLSDVYSRLEAMKRTLDMEDYYVRQVALDDVFVTFAKAAADETILTQTNMDVRLSSDPDHFCENIEMENIDPHTASTTAPLL